MDSQLKYIFVLVVWFFAFVAIAFYCLDRWGEAEAKLVSVEVELSGYRDQTACNLVAQAHADSYNNLRCDALGWPKVGATVTCGCHWLSNSTDYIVLTKEFEPEERER